MFNLEQAISEWRTQMFAAGIKSTPALDELEGHLREDISQNLKSGAGIQKAFEMAVMRIGHAEVLGAEFKRSCNTRETADRWLSRLILAGASFANCWVMALGTKALLEVPMSGWSRNSGFLAVILSVTAIFGGRYLRRFFPTLPDRRIRRAAQAACLFPAVIWFAVFSQIILPRWNLDLFNPAPLLVALLWTIALLPISFRLWKGLDDAATKPFLTAS